MTMPLEDEIAESIATEIAKEIDDGIMADILVMNGWVDMRILNKDLWPHRIVIHKDESRISPEIERWVFEKCGQYKGHWNMVYVYDETHFYFKDGKDATLFALRWA